MPHDRKSIYAALSAPFPPEAIERTDGRTTGKGYSTTGLKYQHVVNRLNEVLGLGGFRVTRKIEVREIATQKGRPAYEATAEVTLQLGEWRDGQFVPFAEAIGDGGHTAMTTADAIKGAFTNGFKKTAAFFGVGRQAYEGTLDDDNLPGETGEPRGRTPVRPRLQSVPAEEGGEATSRPRDAGSATAPPTEQSAPGRRRLTERQRSAIFAIAKARGLGATALRNRIREQYGVLPEYLTKDQASAVIADLQRAQSGNGRGDDPSIPAVWSGGLPEEA